MSLWEFTAAREAFDRHHAPPEGPEAPSAEEHDDMVARYAHIH